ncbi:MAG TPA: SRPBCC domain-containing protein [Candidatus Paceibacterota bacterium]|nr:SRPBCC domain-containing protein [Candidatus Paceibacterota bacterium]HMO82898.1 SRPBCC domain-containing protein [Candidatus Paceibacterota bacterium]
MQKFSTSILINAPQKKVWDILLGPATYREWTKPFNPTSCYEGDWSEGSIIKFLGTDENGQNEGGILSRIAKNIPYEFISIEHLGIIENGVEDTTSEKAKSWAPAFENYTLTEKDGQTEFTVEQDLDEGYLEMFDGMWKEALQRLKELAEQK